MKPRGRPPRTAGNQRQRRDYNSFDAPRPEDVAWRPPSDGGDDDLLPRNRRRPPGLRGTKRVMMGGSRYVTGFTNSDPVNPDDPNSERTSPDAGSGSDDGQQRRRRGRRGGRGRGGSGGGGRSED